MLRVYRLCKKDLAEKAFNGEGASKHGGRWNHVGTPMVYTSTSRALAALESLVHFEIQNAPPKLVIIPAEVPDKLVGVLEPLPAGWDTVPAGEASQDAGTQWMESHASVGLVVPSVVIPREHNVLLNPEHQDFKRIVIAEPEPFSFDPRLYPHREIKGR